MQSSVLNTFGLGKDYRECSGKVSCTESGYVPKGDKFYCDEHKEAETNDD